MKAKQNNKEFLNLLNTSNNLLKKVIQLKIDNKQALGLLTQIIILNKKIILLMNSKKGINLDFMKQIIPIIILYIKEIISKQIR